MVALAILSVGLVTLMQVQARSAELAIQARELTVATMLARGKLYDCQTDLAKRGFSVGDYEAEGNFGDEGYDNFFWECHAYKPDMPVGEIGDGSGAAAALGMGPGAGEDGTPNPADEASMSFLAPVLQQMSHVLGESVRELVIIVRWGQGDAQQELAVTTHVIEKGPVNQVAAMIAQQAKALGAATGTTPPADSGSGGGGSGGKGGKGGKGGTGTGGGPKPRVGGVPGIPGIGTAP